MFELIFGLVSTQLITAAVTALVETGAQVTTQGVINLLDEWGVDVDDGSAWGLLINNFQDNLGAAAQMTTMQLSMGLTRSFVDPLEDKMQAQLNNLNTGVDRTLSKVKNKVGKKRVKGSFKDRYVQTTDEYKNHVKSQTAYVAAGAGFGGAYTQGAATMEDSYNTKAIKNNNLNSDELVNVVNKLMVLQKVG